MRKDQTMTSEDLSCVCVVLTIYFFIVFNILLKFLTLLLKVILPLWK